MNYKKLFQFEGVTHVGLIGAGAFGRCFLDQSRLMPGIRVPVVSDHAIAGVMPEILPAKKMAPDSPIPYYMAAGNRIKHTVEEGRLLTYGMIAYDSQSWCLWDLRRKQDELFST